MARTESRNIGTNRGILARNLRFVNYDIINLGPASESEGYYNKVALNFVTIFSTRTDDSNLRPARSSKLVTPFQDLALTVCTILNYFLMLVQLFFNNY